MKYLPITAKIVEVIIHSVQNEIPCGNLIHEHDRSLQGGHAERPSGMQKSLPERERESVEVIGDHESNKS